VLSTTLAGLGSLAAVGGLLAPATAPTTLSRQLAAQLALALRLEPQQRSLLRAASSRGRDALAAMAAAQLERRMAVVRRMEDVLARGSVDAEAARAVANALQAARQGRLSLFAAGLAVALQVDALLDPRQLGALDRFAPRLETDDAVRAALERLEHEVAAARGERRRGGCLGEEAIAALSAAVPAVLTACELPTVLAEVAGRQVAVALRFEGLSALAGLAPVLTLDQVAAWTRSGAEALAGGIVRPDRLFGLAATVLDSPLLPTVGRAERLKRCTLELVMIGRPFAEHLG
jgi:hypothetical protein